MQDYKNIPFIPSKQSGGCTTWVMPIITEGLQDGSVLPKELEEDYAEEKRQVEERKNAGYQQGLAEGKQHGIQEGLKEFTTKTKLFEELLRSLNVGVKGLNHLFEQQVLQLAKEVAKAVIRHELQTSPEKITAVVKEALASIPNKTSRVNIHLNPADAKLIKTAMQDNYVEGLETISLVPDESLHRGGCIVESDLSHIDMTIEARLAAVLLEVDSTENGS